MLSGRLPQRLSWPCRYRPGAIRDGVTAMTEPAGGQEIQGGLSEREKRDNVIRLALEGCA
jgi:hypothetical protein